MAEYISNFAMPVSLTSILSRRERRQTNRCASFTFLAIFLLAFALCQQVFAETVTNTYDTLNRLTSVVYGNGQQITYTYDAAGNRTAMSGNTRITPDAFSFTPQTNVALNTQISSNTITVSGVNAAPPITITGGEYSINGGTYTIASGNVTNGQTVTVRLTSSNAYSTPATATLTIGGVSATFSVTTIPAPATQPGAPTSVTVTAGNAQATVIFTAPASNGGATIDGYTVTSNPAGGVDTNAGNTSLSHVVTGLTNGTTYTFTVTAHNSAGTSAASAVSNAVTPVATFTVSASAGANGSITPATQTVAQGNTTSFTVKPSTGYMASASGCGGSLNGSTYTTGAITANCTVSATFTQIISFSLLLEQGWNLLGNSIDQTISVTSLFGDPATVTTVWKWDTTNSGWQFYAPSMSAPALQTYATGKGYGVLSQINPGEGYWVNAKLQTSLGTQSGAPFNLTAANLVTGWNLVGTGNNVTPSAFNISLNATPPAFGVTTLWAWDNLSSKWYFYAPSLEAQGGTKLSDYITSKGYLDFTAAGKKLGNGTGFWVNRP